MLGWCDFSKTSRSVGGLFVVWLMIPMKWDCIDEILQTFEHYFMQMFDIRLDLLCSVRILFRGTFGRPPIRQYTATFYRKSLYTKLIQSCRDGSKLFPPFPPPPRHHVIEKIPQIFGSLSIVRRLNFSTPEEQVIGEWDAGQLRVQVFLQTCRHFIWKPPHFLQEVRLLKVAETAGHKIGGVF